MKSPFSPWQTKRRVVLRFVLFPTEINGIVRKFGFHWVLQKEQDFIDLSYGNEYSGSTWTDISWL